MLKIPLAQTGQFSKLLLDYIQNPEKLSDFFKYKPDIESFRHIIENKTNPYREILAQRLKAQYQQVGIDMDFGYLTEKQTFTVTTGHQLNIFTGPLYFIYKLLTTIKLAHQLNHRFPGYRFVPVYWMASEDHDFEEVNHIHLFGRKITWTPAAIGGAVGRLRTTDFAPIWQQFPELQPLFDKYYNGEHTLAEATRLLVHEFFGQWGLIIVDGDDAELKRLFLPIMREELLNQFSYTAVNQSNILLKSLGYSPQITARELNLFYMSALSRDRIIPWAEGFTCGKKNWSPKEILHELENQPQAFSPNVVLRPLYQETILPNVAYVGGPAEIAYWLQIKRVFEAVAVDFPVVLPRNFVMLFPETQVQKIQKLRLEMADVFLGESELKNRFIERNSIQIPDFETEKTELSALFERMKQKVAIWEPTLTASVGAEFQKAKKSLEHLQKRLQKAVEARHTQTIEQVLALKRRFFPDNQPQERHDNFLNFWLNNRELLHLVLNHIEPFEFQYHLMPV